MNKSKNLLEATGNNDCEMFTEELNAKKKK